MKKNIYTNLLGYITKKGKKGKAKKILTSALMNVSNFLHIPVSQIFLRLAEKSGQLVELKKVKLKKNFHLIPFPVKTKRQYFLISREILNFKNIDKKKSSTSVKIAEHIKSFIMERESNIDYKKMLTNQIIANRSNIHYRW